MALQHLRSATADKRPTPAAMSDGQLALNTNLVSPGLFFKDSNGDSVKIGPVHVGTTAPNVTPGAGGQAGNSKGEQWLDTSSSRYVFKIWDGTAWRTEDGEFVNASGDTMTGALVMDNQQQVRFRETTANGSNFIAIQAPTSVAADRTLTLPDVTGTIVSTGDTGSVTSTMILDGTILNADVNASAAIVDTKLATIATAGKVSNSATTATNANTASAIVARDASGNFSAGTITAAVTGAASSNVLKAGDTMTGALVVPLASAATPSLTFTGDLNTGIFSPGADQVAVATNGVERVEFGTSEVVFNDGGENYDFRIESDTNANLVFVDASADRVALGTATPRNRLHVFGLGQQTANITDAGNQNAFIRVSEDSAAAGAGGGILFANTQGDGAGSAGFAAIKGLLTDGSSNTVGDLAFALRATAASTSLQERLRITSAGLVGIGTSAPETLLEIASNAAGQTASTIPTLRITNTDTTAITNDIAGSVEFLSKDASEPDVVTGYIRNIAEDAGTKYALTFGAKNTGSGAQERLRITSAGLVGIGTSAPDTLLTVSQSAPTDGILAKLVNPANASGSEAGIRLQHNNSTQLQCDLVTFRSGANAGLDFNIKLSDSAGTSQTRFTILEGGNVGIGTTSPAFPLHVIGTISITPASTNSGFLLLSGNSGAAAGCTIESSFTSGGYGPLLFKVSNGEAARIDSSGRLLVGTSSAATGFGNLQSHTTAAFAGFYGNFANDINPVVLTLGKSRGNDFSTIVQSGDGVGSLRFNATDGTGNLIRAAQINCEVDGTPGANDMPGRLVFSTTANGASTPTERMRIDNDGVIAYDQPTPATYAAAATLTVADLKTGIITYTGTAATLTLPTGTLTEGGFSGIYTNMAFEWSVINTGAGICTIGAGTTHTIVGSGTVAIGASARFASRRTAANTFVSYCLS